MANPSSLEGYRLPYVAGMQQGEGLLPKGGFLPVRAAQVVAEVCAIPKKWPEDRSYKPIIPTSKAFDALCYESIEIIRERWCI